MAEGQRRIAAPPPTSRGRAELALALGGNFVHNRRVVPGLPGTAQPLAFAAGCQSLRALLTE
jgi:hypothetical protein